MYITGSIIPQLKEQMIVYLIPGKPVAAGLVLVVTWVA